MLRIFLCILAALCVIETVCYTAAANLTLGLVLLYLLSGVLVASAVFYRPLAAFTAHGVGAWLKGLVLAGAAVYFGIACFLAAASLAHPANGGEQALVVLGAGLKGQEISGTLKRRLDAAYAFAQRYPEMPVVVTGGQGRGEARTEASAMKEYLVARGLPEERILLEDRSTSTVENFQFAKTVLAENGYTDVQTVAYVTNRFHCYRAGLIASRTGLTAHAVPASLGTVAILPSYLREVLAVLYYWLLRRGPIG